MTLGDLNQPSGSPRNHPFRGGCQPSPFSKPGNLPIEIISEWEKQYGNPPFLMVKTCFLTPSIMGHL